MATRWRSPRKSVRDLPTGKPACLSGHTSAHTHAYSTAAVSTSSIRWRHSQAAGWDRAPEFSTTITAGSPRTVARMVPASSRMWSSTASSTGDRFAGENGLHPSEMRQRSCSGMASTVAWVWAMPSRAGSCPSTAHPARWASSAVL